MEVGTGEIAVGWRRTDVCYSIAEGSDQRVRGNSVFDWPSFFIQNWIKDVKKNRMP